MTQVFASVIYSKKDALSPDIMDPTNFIIELSSRCDGLDWSHPSCLSVPQTGFPARKYFIDFWGILNSTAYV